MIGTNAELEQQGFNSDEILQNYTQNLKKQDSKTEVQTMQQVTHDYQERVKALEELRKLTEEFNSQKRDEVETP